MYWALEYHTLILFFLKEPLRNKSLYFFLLGYLKAQCRGMARDLGFGTAASGSGLSAFLGLGLRV